MARPAKLEEFDLTGMERPAPALPEPLPEEDRLEVFEQGYKAGWDDATAANDRDQSKITADLEGNLKDLAFTFHEARSHILQGIEPLIRELVEKVLPSFTDQGLPHIVADRLNKALEESTERPITLSVAPASRSAIEAILPLDPGFPLTIREEPTLGEGQVFLNLGAKEEVVDIDETLASVQAAIRDFFELNSTRREANG